MKAIEELASSIKNNFDGVIAQDEDVGRQIWTTLTKKHPAEIAQVFSFLKEEFFIPLFSKLDRRLGAKVFEKLNVDEQADLVESLEEDHVAEILNGLSSDKVIAIFEYLPEDSLEKYLKLTQKKKRRNLISLLDCQPDSAGRLANSEALSLHSEFTVKKSIGVLQGLKKAEDIPPKVFVVDGSHRLLGHVKLSDLVRNKPTKTLAEILRPVEISVNAHDDQETVAELFKRYDVLVMAVKDADNHFLGSISVSEILDVVQEEVTEDSFKMSGLSPAKRVYMEMPFITVVTQRVQWLIPLLLLQSLSAFIMMFFGKTIESNQILTFFLTMLVGTGGNVGNQSATLMVRGLVTGEINMKNKLDVLFREFKVAICTGLILVCVSMVRVFLTPSSTMPSLAAICLSLFAIILSSAFLGAFIPMLLDRFDIDPANSAAPFISTLMDIIGVLIYCLIASLILG